LLSKPINGDKELSFNTHFNVRNDVRESNFFHLQKTTHFLSENDDKNWHFLFYFSNNTLFLFFFPTFLVLVNKFSFINSITAVYFFYNAIPPTTVL